LFKRMSFGASVAGLLHVDEVYISM